LLQEREQDYQRGAFQSPSLILVVIALVMNVEDIRRVVVFYIDRFESKRKCIK